MDWDLDGKRYVNERAVATQQTGFSFVAQARSALPDTIGGLIWFSVDDTSSTVYVPMYTGIQHSPKAYAVGTASFHEFSWDSAFWVFNWVANQAYARYKDEIVDIRKVQQDFEAGFAAEQPKIEREAAELYRRSPQAAEEFLTKYSDESSEKVVTRWKKLGEELLVKYLDGNVRDEHGKVTHPAYPEAWYRKIVAETGDRYYLGPTPKDGGAPAASGSPAPAPPKAAPPAPAPAPEGGHCSMSPTRSVNTWGILGLALAAVAGVRRRGRARG
jgi:hypothetical protein